VLALLLFFAAGCGGDDPAEPDPALGPFVGDWGATSLVITSVANPQIVLDPIQLGASFDLNVQPSGQYTATLAFEGRVFTEIGTLTVSGTTVTLHRTFPTALTTAAVFAFQGAQLTLEGDTVYDFNGDGTAEAARGNFVLIRD
jgi:hypothetical protein